MTDPSQNAPDADRPAVTDTPETNPEQHPDPSDAGTSVAEEPAASEDAPAQPVADSTAATEVAEPVTAAASASVPPATGSSARIRPAPRAVAVPQGPKPLQPYAIVETGGKQYRVSVGDRISVEKLLVDAGNEITFERVLLLGGDGTTEIGTPTVGGAVVQATVDDHFRGEKLVIFKYKAKKRYRRRTGHRQSLTHITITGITR